MTAAGEVFTWGIGEDGQLGHGDRDAKDIPTPVLGELRGRVVVRVSAGSEHTAAVMADGALYTWGLGQSGRLGHGDEQTKLVPTLVNGRAGLTLVHFSAQRKHFLHSCGGLCWVESLTKTAEVEQKSGRVASPWDTENSGGSAWWACRRGAATLRR